MRKEFSKAIKIIHQVKNEEQVNIAKKYVKLYIKKYLRPSVFRNDSFSIINYGECKWEEGILEGLKNVLEEIWYGKEGLKNEGEKIEVDEK